MGVARSGRSIRTGWASRLGLLAVIVLSFETITGLAVTLAPFHAAVQWGLILHTLVGVLTLAPLAWYFYAHWCDYRSYLISPTVLLGYVGVVALLICAVSGLVVTWQGLLGVRMSWGWRQVHLWTTVVALGTTAVHIGLVWVRLSGRADTAPARSFLVRTALATTLGLVVTAGLTLAYSGLKYVNQFPQDYSFLYGDDRPFAPSLATTATGGAFDPRSLAGSESCGSSGCHAEIVAEWQPSAHRYAAMDPLFQGIQKVMAEQNGPESTRYCAGCHDPISLFSGSKNLFTDELTNSQGYHEGVSCLGCHSIRQTDVKGNANYVIAQPRDYLWQWSENPAAVLARDFLIRTYPDEHAGLSRRMFKTSEFCAACHKQFIDEEINRVGWVQLQNQYDNWAASRWNHPGDPTRTVECRECHMPLVDSEDPSAGDATDYNRSPGDGKHRSHRFLASNALVPQLLELEGWKEQVRLTHDWLRGDFEIPEIREKWAEGPAVNISLEAPEAVGIGETIPVRVVLASNKVGHDYPTGPLDIIQSWVELRVTDAEGNLVFSSGGRDEKHFIGPGTFLFKAEPVDQFGNLIDRHNLWEMVGVRFRRSLFPGYSDSVEYSIPCQASTAPRPARPDAAGAPEIDDRQLPAPVGPGEYHVVASLLYRKVDQFLLNYLLGEESGITAPVTEMSRAEAIVRVREPERAGSRGVPRPRVGG